MSTCYTCQPSPGGGSQRSLRGQARRRAARAGGGGDGAAGAPGEGVDGAVIEPLDSGAQGFWAQQGRRVALAGVALVVDLGAAVGIGVLNRWGDNTGLFVSPLLLVAVFLVALPLLLLIRHRRDAALLRLADEGAGGEEERAGERHADVAAGAQTS